MAKRSEEQKGRPEDIYCQQRDTVMQGRPSDERKFVRRDADGMIYGNWHAGTPWKKPRDRKRLGRLQRSRIPFQPLGKQRDGWSVSVLAASRPDLRGRGEIRTTGNMTQKNRMLSKLCRRARLH